MALQFEFQHIGMIRGVGWGLYITSRSRAEVLNVIRHPDSADAIRLREYLDVHEELEDVKRRAFEVGSGT